MTIEKNIQRIAFCPHCGNKAPQKLIHIQHYLEEGYGYDGKIDHLPSTQYVVACSACQELLIYVNFCDQIGADEFDQCPLAWPKHKILDSSVPESIREIYAEASRIKQTSPNGFAVLIRKALEGVCVDRGVKGKNLQKSLERLAEKGEIPPTLAKVSDILRLVGNIGAHWNDESVHPLQVNAMDDFFCEIIEYIYIAPSKIKRFYQRTEK